MRKLNLLAFILFLISTSSAHASQISQITLAELQQKADLIVLAEVIELQNVGNQDDVTIQVDSFLKGDNNHQIFTFTLVTRGGLKDFDPALEVGETGVFFLKQKKQEVEIAYWGSIAIFEKTYIHYLVKLYQKLLEFGKTTD